MALVTSQSTLPDFEYEYHTVIVDTVDDSSKQNLPRTSQHHSKI